MPWLSFGNMARLSYRQTTIVCCSGVQTEARQNTNFEVDSFSYTYVEHARCSTNVARLTYIQASQHISRSERDVVFLRYDWAVLLCCVCTNFECFAALSHSHRKTGGMWMLFNGIESVEFIFIFTLPSAFEDVTLDYFVSCVLRAREREKFIIVKRIFFGFSVKNSFFVCAKKKRERKKNI